MSMYRNWETGEWEDAATHFGWKAEHTTDRLVDPSGDFGTGEWEWQYDTGILLSAVAEFDQENGNWYALLEEEQADDLTEFFTELYEKAMRPVTEESVWEIIEAMGFDRPGVEYDVDAIFEELTREHDGEIVWEDHSTAYVRDCIEDNALIGDEFEVTPESVWDLADWCDCNLWIDEDEVEEVFQLLTEDAGDGTRRWKRLSKLDMRETLEDWA